MHRDASLFAARASAMLLAFAVIGVFAPSTSRDEGPSYRAGYAAASNPSFVRAAMSNRGMSSTSFCEEILKRQVRNPHQTELHNSDFNRGCEHAVHDVME
jgi:hypothetical protein